MANEQLTPKEALIKLKEIFPWANYISLDNLESEQQRTDYMNNNIVKVSNKTQ